MVPVVTPLTDSRSPSPAKVPAVIATVAPASFWVSGSDTTRLGDTVAVWPLMNAAELATDASVGGSLTVAMFMFIGNRLDVLPSFSIQKTVRVAAVPNAVGFRLVELN